MNKLLPGKNYKTVLLVVFIVAVNISCGKKGPLYFPGKTEQVEVRPAVTDKKDKATGNAVINSDTNKVDVNADAIIKVK